MENITFKLLDSQEMGAIKGGGVWVYDPQSNKWIWILPSSLTKN
ncbi:MAG: hypothetical protein RSE02_03340 [Bacteroidales bacterium]